MKVTKYLVGALAASLFFSSCSNDDEGDSTSDFVVSDTYDSTGYAPSTQNVSDKIGELSKLMKTADGSQDSPAIVEASALTAIYQEGTPSFEAAASTNYNALVAGSVFANAEVASTAGNAGENADLSVNTSSGTAGDHLFYNGPIELEQIIEKSSFGGVAFNHVVNVLFANPAAVTKAQLDEAVALYGTDASLEAGSFTSKYSPRNDYSTGVTYHDQISYEFRRAASAIAAGNTSELEGAVAQIEMLWEKSVIAQAITYINDTKSGLGATLDMNNATDYETAADAFHAYSEAVGMIAGFVGVEGIATDVELVAVLTSLNANVSLATLALDVKSNEFLNNPSNLAQLDAAVAALNAAYGF